MLTRFLEITSPIDNTLKELDLGSKCLTEDEVAVVKDLSESLEIIEVGGTALCRRDITVLKSEQIFEYVLKKVAEETGTISQKLLATITDRIESRRNKGICGLVRYLENPDSYDQVVESSLLSYPKKRELTKVAKDVFSQLFPCELIDNSAENLLFCFICFICHFYPPFTRKRIVSLYFGREVRTRLGVAFFEVYGPPVFHIKAGASR